MWHRRLSKFFLDQSDRFPFPNSRMGITLSRIKESQTKESQHVFLRTRPPKDTSIEFLYFRLFDFFYVENVDGLLNGLRKLFRFSNNQFFHGFHYEKFIRNATGISVGERCNIGYVCRDGKGYRYGERHREVTNLPNLVDYIHIELHKVLPSFFVLTYDVVLEKSATEELERLQESYYSSEIVFRRMIPFGNFGGGFSALPADCVMRREILNWVSKLQNNVEKFLEGYLVGDFFHDRSKEKNRLPCIEVYGIRGIPKTKAALRKWFKTSSEWLDSLGFYLPLIDSYTDGTLIFIPKWQYNSDNNRPSYRIIVSWENYIKTIDCNMFGKNENNAVNFNTQENFLTPILPIFFTHELLSRFQNKFEVIRQHAYRHIKPSLFQEPFFGKFIKLSDAVHQASVSYDRISNDFQVHREFVARKMLEIDNFTEIGYMPKNKYMKLNQVLLKGVEFRINNLKEHVNFLMTWISQYLSLRNISVTYFFSIDSSDCNYCKPFPFDNEAMIRK